MFNSLTPIFNCTSFLLYGQFCTQCILSSYICYTCLYFSYKFLLNTPLTQAHDVLKPIFGMDLPFIPFPWHLPSFIFQAIPLLFCFLGIFCLILTCNFHNTPCPEALNNYTMYFIYSYINLTPFNMWLPFISLLICPPSTTLHFLATNSYLKMNSLIFSPVFLFCYRIPLLYQISLKYYPSYITFQGSRKYIGFPLSLWVIIYQYLPQLHKLYLSRQVLLLSMRYLILFPTANPLPVPS